MERCHVDCVQAVHLRVATGIRGIGGRDKCLLDFYGEKGLCNSLLLSTFNYRAEGQIPAGVVGHYTYYIERGT